MAKISDSDKYVRLKQVQDWISTGYSTRMLNRLIETTFGLTSASSRHDLIKKAIDDLYNEHDKEYLRKTNAEKLDAIVQEAMEAGKYRDAVSAIDAMNKLAGLYTEKHEHKFENDITIKFGE